MRISFLGNFYVSFSSESHHAATLESMGHNVVRLQEGEAQSTTILEAALTSDLFVWVHTHGWQTPGAINMIDVLDNLKHNNIATMTYHLDLWFGIQRQKDLETDEFYKHIGHFFTVDRKMADWFNENTEVKGHYLRAGVFEEECYRIVKAEPQIDVAFVGSKGYHPEWSWRPELVDWLASTYNFRHFGGDGERIVRGHDLNELYANTKIVVGDSLCLNFNYPDYWSDRVYETLGRGGFLLMPYIQGLETEFDLQTELPTFKFGDFSNLKQQIDFYLKNDREREVIRQNGFNKVKNNYTYTHRWQTIIKELI